MTKRRHSKPTTAIPVTFNVQALAGAMVRGAVEVNSSSGPTKIKATQRLAGLTEAWTLMTRSDEEIVALVESGEGAAHLARCLDEALVIAADMKAYTASV